MKTKLQNLFIALALSASLHHAAAQGPAFTYQGRLTSGTNAANGSYDMEFSVFDSLAFGNPVGNTSRQYGTAVSNGLFTVVLDFGQNVFTGAARWLSINVRTNGGGAFTVLTPLQPLTPTPYAIYAPGAGTATIASAVSPGAVTGAGIQDGTITAGKFVNGQVVKSLNGLSDTVTLSAGANVTLTTNGNGLQLSSSGGVTNGWALGGNGGITSANFLGTTNNQALELRAYNQRVFRLEPNGAGPYSSPNLIGGFSGNAVTAGLSGNTIAGGGAAGYFNLALGIFGTIGGGLGNIIETNTSETTIAGGNQNRIGNGAYRSTIGGGFLNSISGLAANTSTIGGGEGNTCGSNSTFVGGGTINHANGSSSAIAGGYDNTVGGNAGYIGGGARNRANSELGAIGGGENNTVGGTHGTIGGGDQNNAAGSDAFIGGGYLNIASNNFCTVSGGTVNIAMNAASTVGGGQGNTANAASSTVSGGSGNTASGLLGCVGGGIGNIAESSYTVVSGGNRNTNSGGASSIGGGQFNQVRAGGVNAVIGGGSSNRVYGLGATVSGGLNNAAYGQSGFFAEYPATVGGGEDNTASGAYSTIPGGFGNTASGNYSFAAGVNAHANDDGSFVWGDGTGAAISLGPNSFNAVATGGFHLYVGGGVGVNIAADGTLSCKVLTINGADVAEPFQVSTKEAAKGSVMVIDEDNPGQLKLSDHAYDKTVAGILSGANGVRAGICLSQEGFNDGGQNVALSGRVYVLADASSGPIRPGDLLTTSSIAGHAMKVNDHAKAQGAVLGKAMSGLKEGKGMVLVLVTLQ